MVKPVSKTLILWEALFLISSYISAACCEDPKVFEGPEDDLESHYEIYTKEHSETPVVTYLGKMTEEMFTTKKYYLIVHGFRKSSESPQIVAMKNAFLKKDNATVILLDGWSLSGQGYPQSASGGSTAGGNLAMIISKIRELVDSPYVWCVGHSVGAHVCGQAGKKSKIDRITGLNPAGSLMGFSSDTKNGLNIDSASFVDIIHTNEVLGLYGRMGHADFYPDGGKRQPACEDSDHICHNSIALDYFTESINNHCFRTVNCFNIRTFLPLRSCLPCTKCNYMGYDADPSTNGIFYLDINATSPYCQG